MKVNPPVFFVSAGLILAFGLFGAVFPGRAERLFTAVQSLIILDFGWFYILAVAGFLFFVIFLMMSRYGDVKLGPDDSEAEYSYLSWFAMLFSAGMGIGLLFFGVAEPIQHYTLPPVGTGGTVEAAREALPLTFFHWGLHAWAIYIVVGLALAYFAFRRGLPLSIRSALYPLIGNRIHGPIGHAIDVFSVLGTMFGVATSLGFGALQVNAGFSHLFGLPTGPLTQVILIACITGLATISAAAGLDAGIKRLRSSISFSRYRCCCSSSSPDPRSSCCKLMCRMSAPTSALSSSEPFGCTLTNPIPGWGTGRCSTGAGGSRGRPL